jgi:hypothetical protein
LADFFLLPTLFGFALTPEGKQVMPKFPGIEAWDNRMDALPSVIRFNASLPPRAPIPHAREWVHPPSAGGVIFTPRNRVREMQAPSQTVETVQAPALPEEIPVDQTKSLDFRSIKRILAATALACAFACAASGGLAETGAIMIAIDKMTPGAAPTASNSPAPARAGRRNGP